LRARHILPLLAMRRTKNGSGLGRWRWVVEGTFARLNQSRRLRVRYDKRADIHEAFLSLGCAWICGSTLRKAGKMASRLEAKRRFSARGWIVNIRRRSETDAAWARNLGDYRLGEVGRRVRGQTPATPTLSSAATSANMARDTSTVTDTLLVLGTIGNAGE
jgi:hypothetical protein